MPAFVLRLRVEDSMSAVVPLGRGKEVAGAAWLNGSISELRTVAGAGQVIVYQAGHELINQDSRYSRAAYAYFPPSVMGRPDNGFGCHLWLINGRHWLADDTAYGFAPN